MAVPFWCWEHKCLRVRMTLRVPGLMCPTLFPTLPSGSTFLLALVPGVGWGADDVAHTPCHSPLYSVRTTLGSPQLGAWGSCVPF
jgi:hypothetical protein